MNTADREIVQTRLINAPREKVWKVWTDPVHIAKWWGPNGFTNTVYEMSVTPGGAWRYMMHGPDGTDWPNKIVYETVKEPELLVYTHGDFDMKPDETFHVTVTFEEQGTKTALTMRSVFSTAAHLEAVKKFGAVEGGKQTINKLEAYLETM